MSRDKFILILVLIFSVFMVYNLDYRGADSNARIWDNGERDFFKPIDIVWRGKIISTMAGGSCVGLRGEFDNYSQAMACFLDMDSGELWKLEGTILIAGKWLGITCAYKNTIFGQCVPNVSIESIKMDSR